MMEDENLERPWDMGRVWIVPGKMSNTTISMIGFMVKFSKYVSTPSRKNFISTRMVILHVDFFSPKKKGFLCVYEPQDQDSPRWIQFIFFLRLLVYFIFPFFLFIYLLIYFLVYILFFQDRSKILRAEDISVPYPCSSSLLLYWIEVISYDEVQRCLVLILWRETVNFMSGMFL